MPPSGTDNIRAYLTTALNNARGRRALDLGTHIELESNGRTYKITVEHVGPEDGRDRLAPRDIGPFNKEGT